MLAHGIKRYVSEGTLTTASFSESAFRKEFRFMYITRAIYVRTVLRTKLGPTGGPITWQRLNFCIQFALLNLLEVQRIRLCKLTCQNFQLFCLLFFCFLFFSSNLFRRTQSIPTDVDILLENKTLGKSKRRANRTEVLWLPKYLGQTDALALVIHN